jgi:hypothetical protein
MAGLRHGPCLVIRAVREQHPRGSGLLVGQGDCGDVGVGSRLKLRHPQSDGGRRFFEEPQHAARTVDEQCPDIGVPSLANAKQCRSTASRMLPGDEAQPGGKIAPSSEPSAVADGSNDCCCGDRPDSRDGCEALACGVLLRDCLELSLEVVGINLHPLFEEHTQ